MKILVLSDTHGRIENAAAVLNKLAGRIDMVFHLGDHDSDALLLKIMFDNMPFYFVKGNNDFDIDVPYNRRVTAGGKRFLLTHGHREHVHFVHERLSYWATEEDVCCVAFGHTHVPCNEWVGGVLLFNPGSISLPRDSRVPTFGILTIEGERLEGAIMEYTAEGEISRRR